LEHTLVAARETFRCDAADVIVTRSSKRLEVEATTNPASRSAAGRGHGEGPWLDATPSDGVYVSDDTRRDPRWPAWGECLATLGWLSVLATRLDTPGRNFGFLNLYSREPAAFGPAEAEAAGVFAHLVGGALAAAAEGEQLRQAVESRHIIGQAQGILMEREGISAEEVFSRLRSYSQDNNVKLQAVARHVVDHRCFPQPGELASPPPSPRAESLFLRLQTGEFVRAELDSGDGEILLEVGQ